MFSLEKSITEWRRQMETAGIKTSASLDELEAHLREDVDHRVHAGEPQAGAFANAVRELGQPAVLECEFKKNEHFGEKKWGALAILAALVMFVRVAMMHEAGRVGPGDQIGGTLVGLCFLFFGLDSVLFNFNLGVGREIRLWKLAGLTYSGVAVFLSLFPLLRLFTFGGLGWKFGVTHWLLALVAVMASVLANWIWRMCRKFLPVISNRWAIAAAGIAGCLAGPALMALFFYFVVPTMMGRVHTQTAFVALAWLWALMALLAGAGRAFTEAAAERATVSPAANA